MIRRVGGLLIAVLMLQVNVQPIAAACSTSSPHVSNSSTSHTKTTAQHHHSASAWQEVEHNQAPCETPVRADCCQAMTSCSNSVFSTSASGQIATQREIVVTTPYTLRIPASRITAPDPPPPKA